MLFALQIPDDDDIEDAGLSELARQRQRALEAQQQAQQQMEGEQPVTGQLLSPLSSASRIAPATDSDWLLMCVPAAACYASIGVWLLLMFLQA